jgi:hypothetical protein
MPANVCFRKNCNSGMEINIRRMKNSSRRPGKSKESSGKNRKSHLRETDKNALKTLLVNY